MAHRKLAAAAVSRASEVYSGAHEGDTITGLDGTGNSSGKGGVKRLRMLDVSRCPQIGTEMVQWMRMYVAEVRCGGQPGSETQSGSSTSRRDEFGAEEREWGGRFQI